MVWRRRVIRTRSSRSCGGRGARAGGLEPGPGLRRGAGAGGVRAGFHAGQGVALGDPSVLAGAGDGGGVETVLGHDALHRRGERQGGRASGVGRR